MHISRYPSLLSLLTIALELLEITRNTSLVNSNVAHLARNSMFHGSKRMNWTSNAMPWNYVIVFETTGLPPVWSLRKSCDNSGRAVDPAALQEAPVEMEVRTFLEDTSRVLQLLRT